MNKLELETMLILEYLNLGIIPHNVNLHKALDSLSPSDARKARRKFRKLYRKRRKEVEAKLDKRKTRKGWENGGYREQRIPTAEFRESHVSKSHNTLEAKLGCSDTPPAAHQISERKKLVYGDIYKSVTKKYGHPKKPFLEGKF